MTVSTKLVEWAWNLDLEDVPSGVRDAAKRHLLDGLGNALAGHASGRAGFAVATARSLGGPPDATIIGEDQLVGTAAAALANGVLVHVLDFDDTHADALVHPTAVTLPAMLAVGQQTGASGRKALTAAMAGYEVALRLGAAIRHGFHRRGFHATSVVGTTSAALVAAHLRGLDQSTALAAVGIAGSQASGLLEFLETGSSTKQLHPGWSSLSGIVAAELAAQGGTGPSTVLEGRLGLYRAYADEAVDPSTILDGLGTDWLLDGITIKPYPACQLVHASLDGIEQLRDRLPRDLDTITRICVELPHDSMGIVAEPVESKRAPRTPYEAKFSVQWTVAAQLIDGPLGVRAFEVDQLGREDVLSLARRVDVEAYDPGVAAAAAPGLVVIDLASGEQLIGQVDGSRGSPARPLSDDEVADKFHQNAGGEDADSRALVDAVLALDELDDIEHIVTLAQRVAVGRRLDP